MRGGGKATVPAPGCCFLVWSRERPPSTPFLVLDPQSHQTLKVHLQPESVLPQRAGTTLLIAIMIRTYSLLHCEVPCWSGRCTQTSRASAQGTPARQVPSHLHGQKREQGLLFTGSWPASLSGSRSQGLAGLLAAYFVLYPRQWPQWWPLSPCPPLSPMNVSSWGPGVEQGGPCLGRDGPCRQKRRVSGLWERAGSWGAARAGVGRMDGLAEFSFCGRRAGLSPDRARRGPSECLHSLCLIESALLRMETAFIVLFLIIKMIRDHL